MRKVVIVGPPPVQILDVAGAFEVFSSAGDYDVVLGNPAPGRTLQTSRKLALADAVPIHEITGPIDTLVIAGGPGAETEATAPRLYRGSRTRRRSLAAPLPFARVHFYLERLDLSTRSKL